VIRAEIPQHIIKIIKRRLQWKKPLIPFELRSEKDTKKWDKMAVKQRKLQRKGKTKKAKKIRRKMDAKYGYGEERIVWDRLEPRVTDPTTHITYWSIPIEAAPAEVAKQQRSRVAARKAQHSAELNSISSPRDWILFNMRHSDMWTGIPSVFKAIYPNSTVKAPSARSPGEPLANDWSNNYAIGLMCYMLKCGGHVDQDADFECANS
jgi:hypothetical protein